MHVCGLLWKNGLLDLDAVWVLDRLDQEVGVLDWVHIPQAEWEVWGVVSSIVQMAF